MKSTMHIFITQYFILGGRLCLMSAHLYHLLSCPWREKRIINVKLSLPKGSLFLTSEIGEGQSSCSNPEPEIKNPFPWRILLSCKQQPKLGDQKVTFWRLNLERSNSTSVFILFPCSIRSLALFITSTWSKTNSKPTPVRVSVKADKEVRPLNKALNGTLALLETSEAFQEPC